MTPTEQDDELEFQLDKIFPCDCSFKKGFAFKPGDPCDGSCVNAPYRKAVLELITADRKRVALEARIHEIGLMQHQARVNLKTSNAVAEWGDIRITELKRELDK